jgi:hypothetical protein
MASQALLRDPFPATLIHIIRTTPTCVKHQQITEEIHGSKSRLPTTYTTTFLIQTTVMSTTQTTSTLETPTLTTCTETILIQTTMMSTTLTTSTLETPTLTMPTLPAISLAPVLVTHTLQVHSTLAYISPQPWQCQPNSSSGKSLVKQDPQNRSYPKQRKARKRHKKKRPKPSPPSPHVTGALCAQIKETQQLPDHLSPSPWRAPMNTKRGITSYTESS